MNAEPHEESKFGVPELVHPFWAATSRRTIYCAAAVAVDRKRDVKIYREISALADFSIIDMDELHHAKGKSAASYPLRMPGCSPNQMGEDYILWRS